ncbi:hypothetical protein [Mesorhizobium sp.]|uniref:hypothetical protein n=1 Tax=Mesorhizobium sp. TaxID=1871066 RepID=UPI002580DB49|nr:hypothetical protein [Mesorhizobium sp.]
MCIAARRGDNLSPFLAWSDPPPGTQSYVLVMEDTDAPSQAAGRVHRSEDYRNR